MIIIDKKEKDYLLSKGARFHTDIFRTHSKHPTYYCKESDRLMKLLREVRK